MHIFLELCVPTYIHASIEYIQILLVRTTPRETNTHIKNLEEYAGKLLRHTVVSSGDREFSFSHLYISVFGII